MFRVITPFSHSPTALRGAAACGLLATSFLVAPAVCRAQTMTPAGTVIDNVAALTFTDVGPMALTSNKVSLQVQEILDVDVESLIPELEVEADTHDQRLAFRIRNLGNGWQAFDLSLTVLEGDFDPSACRLIVDWNGDGLMDPAHDRISSTTPVLAPGQSVIAWVSCGIPSGAAHGALGRILLRAFPSVLRNGASETVMATAGNGGVYVVMGPRLRGGGTGGTSTPATYKVGQVSAQLIKAQAVADTAGGARAMPGSIVTYSLEARFGAGANARQVNITDAIPNGSTYVPGSLTLDGAALTDGEDGDAGRFADGGVAVALAEVAARTSRFVTFKVRINPLENAS
jgi:uncharacterized repeat protein (TIGR01451 family)